MHRMDVASAIGPAFDHMVRVLFRPFDLRKWLGLGFIALFLGSGGGHGNGGSGGHQDWNRGGMPDVMSWLSHYWPVLVLGFVALLAVGLLFGWLSSVFRFVFIDDIVRNSGRIKEPFARLKGLGTSFFLWNLAFGLVTAFSLLVLVGVPVLLAFVVIKGASDGLQVLAVIWAVLAFLSMLLAIIIVDGVARGFVATTMYAKGVGVLEAWRIMLPILKTNAVQIALYFLLQMVFGIGIAIASIVILIPVAIVVGIPFGILALIGYIAWETLRLTWSAPVIAAVAVLAASAIAVLAYLLTCVTLPATVFLQTYPLVILGQADPSLATIPIDTPQPSSAPEG